MKTKLNAKKVILILVGVIALAAVLEAICVRATGEMLWEVVPGADAIVGFVGGWLLILFAKKVVGPLLQRREDYYGGDDDQ